MITREEFIRGYCERSNLTVEQFFEFGDAAPCDCGEGGCQGWQYETRGKHRLERLERRVAEIEAVTPRCAIKGCEEWAPGRDACCSEHAESWSRYVSEHWVRGARSELEDAYDTWKMQVENELLAKLGTDTEKR